MNTGYNPHIQLQLSEDEIMSETKRLNMTVKQATLALLQERYGDDHSDQTLLLLAAGEVTGTDASVGDAGRKSKFTMEQKRDIVNAYLATDRSREARERVCQEYGVSEWVLYQYIKQVEV